MDREDTRDSKFINDFKRGAVVVDVSGSIERTKVLGANHQDDGIAVCFNDYTFSIYGIKQSRLGARSYSQIELPPGCLIDVFGVSMEVQDKAGERVFFTKTAELLIIYNSAFPDNGSLSYLCVKRYH